MSSLPKLIDNQRISLSEVLKSVAPSHQHLSIATGYWDLPGTLEIIDQIKDYKQVRLLIGQEPIATAIQKKYGIDRLDEFPDQQFAADLIKQGTSGQLADLRKTAAAVNLMIQEQRLEVRVFREPRLHAKAYIFGDYASDNAVGIIGSSNFTLAGLTTNVELNTAEQDYRVVTFKPENDTQENGHLSWFDAMWTDPSAEEWSGLFSDLLSTSPVGNVVPGAYDAYIKALMTVFPEELEPPAEIDAKTADILFSFQNRNAGILIKKLRNLGVAMLADSVGLGKTITAGAVIKHYRADNPYARIVVIPPASLKKQWSDELADTYSLIEGSDYRIVTQQNAAQLDEAKDFDRIRPVDLFVIDEAHNLRNQGSTRYQAFEEWFFSNPSSHVLLLTATPINNSLNDFVNQIQLGSKGSLDSVPVPYPQHDGDLIKQGFFTAVRQVQSAYKRHINEQSKLAATGQPTSPFNWERYSETFKKGIAHYLVRSTRRGVEAEGTLVSHTGQSASFPESRVDKLPHSTDPKMVAFVSDTIEQSLQSCFEGIDPRCFNTLALSEYTQFTCHPLDAISSILSGTRTAAEVFGSNDSDEYAQLLQISSDDEKPLPSIDLVKNIYQSFSMLAFVPYRTEVYKHTYYGKTVQQINSLGIKGTKALKLRVAQVAHCSMHITWLKRLESSFYALYKSLTYYKERLELFTKHLNAGYIFTIGDALTLEKDEYADDIERAFSDYQSYLRELELAYQDANNKHLPKVEIRKLLKKRGVEQVEADENVFNIKQMKTDLARDVKILDLLIEIMLPLTKSVNDKKIEALVECMDTLVGQQKYGNKVLVFSFFADTIEYLQNELAHAIEAKHGAQQAKTFSSRAEFISGNTVAKSSVANITNRFSPNSKGYKFNDMENEIDYLFSTDVLSEGQNLQDAGILINYDLHWNPVRMIQRNGRINRLGSRFKEVYIANAVPVDELEEYIQLMKRLETKIDLIRNTIGTDQSIMGEDANPIEYIEKYYNMSASEASQAAMLYEAENDILAWSDEYLDDLRQFLATNSDKPEVIARIQSIPEGKWCLLPEQNNDSTELSEQDVLVLVKTSGELSVSGIAIQDTSFFKLDASGRFPQAEYLHENAALRFLKTQANDNEQRCEKLQFDRVRIANFVKSVAETKASETETYRFTEKQNEAFEHLLAGGVDQGLDLKGILAAGIKTARHEREVKRVLRQVNADYKENSALAFSTIQQFNKIFKEVQAFAEGEPINVGAASVLYWAKDVE